MDRLKGLRIEQKLSQTELSNILGVRQNTYSKWESGQNEMKYDNLKRVATFFNVSTDYLLGLTDEKTPPKITKEAEMLKNATAEQLQTIKTILKLNSNEVGEVKGYAAALLNRTKKPFEEI